MSAKTPELDSREDYSKNIVINGNMDFWQRGTSFASPIPFSYTADRFQTIFSNTATRTISKDLVLIPNSQSISSLKYLVGTADASVAAGDAEELRYLMEGSDFLPLAGKVFTLSFWVRSSITGTYCVSFRNSTTTRSYVTTYSISLANTWEYKTITLTHDTSGTWDYGSGMGLAIGFTFMAGTTYQTVANSWTNGNFISVAGAVNLMGTAGAQWNLSQVQITEGSEALPFRRAGKTIATELALCQRYYEKTYDTDTPPASPTNTGAITWTTTNMPSAAGRVAGVSWKFRVTKRAIPAVTTYGNSGVINVVAMTTGNSASVIANTGMNNTQISGTDPATTGNVVIAFQATAEAEL
jgi:hypothetical protein